MSNIRERREWIDRARGYALLMVVVGHMGIPIVGKYITAFHIPLFFFLSGVTFRMDNSFGDFLKKKVKRLLVPYLFMGIPLMASSIISRAIRGISDPREYVEVLWKFIVQRRYCTIWFLTCLFLLNIIFYLLVKVTHDNYKIIIAVSIILAALGLLYYNMGGVALPWNIDVCLTALPFFAAGYVCKVKEDLIKPRIGVWPDYMFIASAVIYVLSVTINIKISGQVIDMAVEEYGCIPFSMISVVCGIYCVYFFADKVHFRLPAYFGKHTMVYFSWHQSIVLPLLLYVYSKVGLFQQDTFLSDGLRIIVTVVMIFVVLLPFDLLFRKTKLKFCVGE